MLTWRNHFRTTALLALPVCLSNIGQMTVDLVDNFFIGKLPEKTSAQAAIALASSCYFIVLVLLIGVSYALTPIVAEAEAQKNKNRILTHLRHSFILNIVTAVFLFLLLFM